MKKLSLYLKVTALLMITLLIFSPLASFADEVADTTQKPNDTQSETTKSNNTNSGILGGLGVDKALSAEYEEYVSNNNFSLSLSKNDYWVKITDKRSGKEWCSTPLGVTADKIAKNKPQRESVISVQFNDRSGVANTLFSSTQCVKKDGLKVEKIDNGVKMIFNFPDHGITVPIQILLTDTGIKFEILYKECESTNDGYKLTKVGIMPFFGAADSSTDGYLFIPDGQGALVDFKKANGDVNFEYRQSVYGRDSAKIVKAKTNFIEKIKMPVFGIKNNNSAFTGIIEQGDSRTEIVAITKGSLSNFNTVYPEFTYRDYDDIVAKEKNWGAKTFKVFEKQVVSGDKYVVSYTFDNDEKANYAGMATNYRNYLINAKGVKKTALPNYAPLNLEIIGSLKRPVNIAGFPIESVVPLANFKDVQEMTDLLSQNGVSDMVIDYRNWYSGSSEGIIPNNISADGALGGLNELQKLNEHLKTTNTKLFGNIDISDLYKSGNGINRNGDATRHLDMQPTMMYFFDRDTYQKEEWDKLKDTRFLLSPKKFVSVSENILKQAKEQNYGFTGISDNGISSKIYSDFNKDSVDRIESQAMVEESLKNFASVTGQFMASDANAYALNNATFVTNSPIQNSGYYTFTDTVPFYQIVLQGFIPNATIAVNSEGDVRNATLKALETGSQVSFRVIKENAYMLRQTIYDDYINCEFDNWMNDILKIYKEITPITSKVSDKVITNHEILQNGVNRTTFENGIQITINFNYHDVVLDGVTIKSQEYIVGEVK